MKSDGASKPKLRVVASDGERTNDHDELPSGWPRELGEAAFHGLAGEEIRFDVGVVVSNSIGLIQSRAECRQRRL